MKMMKSLPRRASVSLVAPLAAMCLMTTPAARADDAAPSRVDALVNSEFANMYLTPRGMIVHDQGLTFQELVLGLVNLYKGDGPISSVTFTPGVWNDFSSSSVSSHAPFGSSPKVDWVEIDPIAGLSFGLGKHWTLSATYTSFNMQILDIPFSQHMETKLALDDSDWLKAFALHPYIIYWQELSGKATAAQVPYLVDPLHKGSMPLPGSSYYFDVGITPGYTYEPWGLKMEAPMRILLPDSQFYGEYYSKASTVGLFELGAKLTEPLSFMPAGYGHWSAHAGFKYMNLVDNNLASMQEFNAPGKKTRDTVQIFFGLTAFF